METSQITQIAIEVGAAGTKASIALGVALLSGIAAVIAAVIAGFFKWKLDQVNKEYQSRWAFINKKAMLYDAAIEICSRILWNKLLLAVNKLPLLAQDNLFLLAKDCQVVETQLLLYGNQHLADALNAFRGKILSTPDNKVVEEWTSIIEEGRKQIYELKKDLHGSLTEEYKVFTNKLKPPDIKEISEAAVNKIGSQLIK